MKTQAAKRTISVLIMFMLLVGTMFVSTGEAQAASKPKIIKETLWAGCDHYPTVNFSTTDDDFYEKAKLISIKSSNKKVIAVKKTGSEIWNHYLKPKKPGKSKITVKYKLKGKTYTASATYKVKKYPAPLKSVKVNGKNIDLKKYKYSYVKDQYKKTSVKVKYQPKSGWKLEYAGAYMYDYETNKSKDINIKKNSIKKGTTIKFPKKYDYLVVNVQLKNKQGDTIWHLVGFDR